MKHSRNFREPQIILKIFQRGIIMSAIPDRIDASQKISESAATKASPAEDLEGLAPNKEHFQNLINSTNPMKHSFERIGGNPSPENVETIEKNPIFTDENVSSQKSGSATDQEKKGRQDKDEDETEAISNTQGKKNKTSTDSSSSKNDLNLYESDSSDLSKITSEKLSAQATQIISHIDSSKTTLSKIKEIAPSHQALMGNRLTHIDNNVKIALSKTGLESTAPPSKASSQQGNKVKNFIDSLTSSQANMQNLQTYIAQLSSNGQRLSPVQMMSVQLTMNQIQQQLELFTSLLNKALESVKTIMNVQV